MALDECFLDSLEEFHRRSATGKSRREIDTEYYHRPDKAANRLAPVERQCDWLRAVGFERVDCFFKIFELALFGGLRPATADDRPVRGGATGTASYSPGAGDRLRGGSETKVTQRCAF